VTRLYGVMNQQLANNGYVAGDFYSTAALGQPMARLERGLVAVKSHDNVQREHSLASERHNNLQKVQELLIRRTF
jgi:hypothetical protein